MDNLKNCSFRYELDEHVTVLFSGRGYSSPDSFVEQHFSKKINVFQAEQTHGNKVAMIKNEFAGPYLDVDALATDKVDCALTIRTADCVPIMLYDKGSKAIAAIHSGLNSTISDILGETILLMRTQYASKPADIQAFIGPCIHKCCYEVDQPIVDRIKKIPFYKELIEQVNSEHYMLDLQLFNKLLLRLHEIRAHNVVDINMCTKCMENEFYSYRRDHSLNRMYSMIVRESI